MTYKELTSVRSLLLTVILVFFVVTVIPVIVVGVIIFSVDRLSVFLQEKFPDRNAFYDTIYFVNQIAAGAKSFYKEEEGYKELSLEKLAEKGFIAKSQLKKDENTNTFYINNAYGGIITLSPVQDGRAFSVSITNVPMKDCEKIVSRLKFNRANVDVRVEGWKEYRGKILFYDTCSQTNILILTIN